MALKVQVSRRLKLSGYCILYLSKAVEHDCATQRKLNI